jgi:hypothetical protein
MAEYAASYCERCGTRYTFGSGPSVGAPLKDARVLAKGLKYFVLSNSVSMGEAMAYARNDVQSNESSRVTEMFRKTFNFCMTCRQYACDNCWNEAQGACLSCAPESGIQPVEPADLLLVRTPVSRPESSPAGSTPREGDVPGSISMRPAMPAWPTQDVLSAGAADSGGASAAAAASDAESARQVNRRLWPIQDDLDAERLDLTPEELALVEGQLEHLAPHVLADTIDASSAEAARNEAAAVAAELVAAAEMVAAADEAAEMVAAADEAERAAAAELVAAADEAAELAAAAPKASERIAAAAVERDLASHFEPEVGPWPSATPWSVRAIQSRGHVLGPVVVEQSGPAGVGPEQPLDLPGGAVSWVPVETPVESTYAMEPFAQPESIVQLEAVSEPEAIAEHEAASQLGADTVDDLDRSVPEQVMEPIAEPLAAAAAAEAAPIETPPIEPVAIVPAPVQQPLFDAPLVSTDRWAATPAPWQPMGASWPAPVAPDAPWPGPDPSAIPAAIVAAQQAAQPVGPAIWAASSQQVMSRGNVRACHHCALPVSTHARFCRRCGTEQA